MIGRALSRRRWFCGIALVAAVLAAVPAKAQEEVLKQHNDGEATYWLPIISALYARPDQVSLNWPPDNADGPPVPTPGDVISPALHFALNPAPAESPATIDTDWVIFQKRLQGDEQASAFVLAFEHGKPRLWLHRCIEETKLAGYPQSRRFYIMAGIEIVHERFPIAGSPPMAVRTKLIRDTIRIVSGKVTVSELDGVATNGSGKAGETPVASFAIGESSLADFGQRPLGEFIPTKDTEPKGDRLDHIIRIAIELELEAGTALGLKAPERRTLSGEIRLAVGKAYFEATKVSGESGKR